MNEAEAREKAAELTRIAASCCPGGRPTIGEIAQALLDAYRHGVEDTLKGMNIKKQEA